MEQIVLYSKKDAIVKATKNALADAQCSLLIKDNIFDVLNTVISDKLSAVILDICKDDKETRNYMPLIKSINPNIPLIVLCCENSLDLERTMRNMGIFFYGLWPMSEDELNSVITSAVSYQEHNLNKNKKYSIKPNY